MILKPDQILSEPMIYPLPSQFNVEEARTREQSIRTVLSHNTAYRVYTMILKIYLSFMTVMVIIAIGILSSLHEFVPGPLMSLAFCSIAYLTFHVVIGWVGVYSLNTIWLKVYLALDAFEWFIVLITIFVLEEYSRLWALIPTTLSGGLVFGIIRQVSKTVSNVSSVSSEDTCLQESQ